MKLHLAQLPRLIAERRSAAVFGVVIIAMLWGGICFKYYQDLRGDMRQAERTNRNFAMVFEENVLRSIGEIDKALLYLRRIVESRGAEGEDATVTLPQQVIGQHAAQGAGAGDHRMDADR